MWLHKPPFWATMIDRSWLTDLGPVKCGSRQRRDRTEVLRTTKPDGLPLDTRDELLQPLGDQLNLILTQSKCQMTINFQGSWHCAICQHLLVREFENNKQNKMAWEHFATINKNNSSEQFYSRTQCDSTSLPSRLPWTPDQVGEIMLHRLRTCDVRLQAKTR